MMRLDLRLLLHQWLCVLCLQNFNYTMLIIVWVHFCTSCLFADFVGRWEQWYGVRYSVSDRAFRVFVPEYLDWSWGICLSRARSGFTISYFKLHVFLLAAQFWAVRCNERLNFYLEPRLYFLVASLQGLFSPSYESPFLVCLIDIDCIPNINL